MAEGPLAFCEAVAAGAERWPRYGSACPRNSPGRRAGVHGSASWHLRQPGPEIATRPRLQSRQRPPELHVRTYDLGQIAPVRHLAILRVMSEERSDNSLSIRELQRNAAEVMTRVEHGASYVITRHGRTVGLLSPPDAGDQAIAPGILDSREFAHARTAAQVARIVPEPTEDPDSRPASEALAELRI